MCHFFFQAEDGIRDWSVTGVQTCALPILAVDLQAAVREKDEGVVGRAQERRPVAESRERLARSEERRVGKECRSRWAQNELRKKVKNEKVPKSIAVKRKVKNMTRSLTMDR